MEEERIIMQADLQRIENSLGSIYDNIHHLGNGLNYVQNKVDTVSGDVGNLAQEFHKFVMEQEKANRLSRAEIRIVKIRQELEKRFGYYDKVRRTTIGILQANDLGIVRKETISVATEELMISAPGYWLAPCLVALAAWISNQPKLAEKAVREGMNRNSEKASLFFILLCQRAGRKKACLEWTRQYLSYQDERNLNRRTMVILNAYASGLLGVDSERFILGQMTVWLNRLEEDFINQQRKQWEDAIWSKRGQVQPSQYMYLRKYSLTWDLLQKVLEGAYLHKEILVQFQDILEQEPSREEIKVQLDEIMDSLVSDYDDEELPLRKEEQIEQFVIDFEGDENRAREKVQNGQTTFEVHKNFSQLLADAAMDPDNSHANIAMQKLAIVLSKKWIMEAYVKVTERNRRIVPHAIEISVDTFSGKTVDGRNEYELLREYSNHVNEEQRTALQQRTLSLFDQFCNYGGWIIAGGGLLVALAGLYKYDMAYLIFGLVIIAMGAGFVVYYFSKKNAVEEYQKKILQSYARKRNEGTRILSAILAEAVDFRREFELRDAEKQIVMEYLEQITANQYIKRAASIGRGMNI